MAYVTVSVSVPRDLLERFDEARGLVFRSTLLQDLMRSFVEREDAE